MRAFLFTTALIATALPHAASAGNTPPNPGEYDYSEPYLRPSPDINEPSDLFVVKALTAAKAHRFAEGVSLLRDGAGLGNARAMLLLGDAYASGTGVVQDDAEAVRWYRAGAEAGDHRAMLALGIAYGRGLGIEADKKSAAQWLRRARETDEGGIRRTANDVLRKLGF